MKWETIRAEYTRLFNDAKNNSGATQATIARAGGLIGPDGTTQQAGISKLMHNRRKGPSVEMFVCAVEGLGISVSEFFTLVEQRAHGASVGELAAARAREGLTAQGRPRDEVRRQAFALETLVGALADALEPTARQRLARRLVTPGRAPKRRRR